METEASKDVGRQICPVQKESSESNELAKLEDRNTKEPGKAVQQPRGGEARSLRAEAAARCWDQSQRASLFASLSLSARVKWVDRRITTLEDALLATAKRTQNKMASLKAMIEE